MIYVTVERTVRRRPEVVWEHLVDPNALTSWIEGAIAATVTSPVTRGVGLTVEIERVRRAGHAHGDGGDLLGGAAGSGATTRATCEVTAWRDGSLVAVETRLGDSLHLDRATVEAHPHGTRLGVYAEILRGGGMAELFARPGGPLRTSPIDEQLQAIYERSVDALVKRIEALTAAPYR